MPIADSVNIPFGTLRDRVHELPPRSTTVLVPQGVENSTETLDWLARGGRRAELRHDFEWGGKPLATGRLWRPSGFICEVMPLLQCGTALDLGCGSGRNAAYLASEGFSVTGVDRHLYALRRAASLSRLYTARAETSWIRYDLGRQTLDVTSAEATKEHLMENPWLMESYDLILFIKYMSPQRLSEAVEMLKPGGSILVEAFTERHRARYGKPKQDLVTAEEIRSMLGGLEIMRCSEAWHCGAHTARIWARR